MTEPSKKNQSEPDNPSREQVWQMFDRISHRYDLLNRMLSFGQDIKWRKKVATLLKDTPDQHLLDLATGTGDLLISLCKNSKLIVAAVGLDMSGNMLKIGQKKLIKENLGQLASMVRGNAEMLPFQDNSYDIITISFGIRNVTDVNKSLKEMYRVLKPGGRVLILEFSLPENSFVRNSYLFYFRYVLPFVGSIISGDSYAYKYLNKTVETFPFGEKFCNLMRNVGFEKVHATPLTLGVATIYQGDCRNEAN